MSLRFFAKGSLLHSLAIAQAEELSDKMCPYIRSPTIAAGEMTEEDRKMQIWPLIKNVEVTLPYSQVIPEGVVFVDIPGTGDFNSKRDEMWKEVSASCPTRRAGIPASLHMECSCSLRISDGEVREALWGCGEQGCL